MNKILIDLEIYEYLSLFFKNKNILYNQKSSNLFEITIDDDDALEIEEWASTEQIRIGFDAHYNLTKEGKILEKIIDKFCI